MKFLIFTDLHANLAALEKIYDFYQKIRPDRVYFLGDLVGYGHKPKECLDFISTWPDIYLIQGNHDRAASGDFIGLDRYSAFAFNSLLWTQEVLDSAYKKILADLPLCRFYEDIGFVHSSLLNPRKFPYIRSNWRAWLEFFGVKKRIIFSGHTHKIKIWESSGYKIKSVSEVEENKKIFLAKDKRYLIQCGSAGFKNGVAELFIFDFELYSLELYKLKYKPIILKKNETYIEVPNLI